MKPGCNRQGHYLSTFGLKPGCNRQGQTAAAVGEGEDGSLLFSATTHLFSTTWGQFVPLQTTFSGPISEPTHILQKLGMGQDRDSSAILAPLPLYWEALVFCLSQ